MTVEQITTAPPVRGVLRPGVHPTGHATTYPPSQRTPAREGGPMCLMVSEIPEGEAPVLVRNLRRRESMRAVLLARSAARRDLVTLLGGGVRGAVSTSPVAAARPELFGATTRALGPELTARELGVLRLVADGRSNRQIGEELELSALTVKSHLARISRKVGTGDRAEMVAYVIRNELLS